MCGGRISDPLTTVRERDSEKPAHFDCVLKRLGVEKRIAPHEKIYYLGGGNFGIVTERRSRGRLELVIRERFEYESRKRGHARDEED
jgi:hypothetical protein